MSKRILKLQDHLRDEVGRILLKEFDFENDALITVTDAEVSKNAASVKIFISVIPKKFQNEVIKKLKKESPRLRFFLKKRLKAKIIPSLNFVPDQSYKILEKIEEIMDKEI